MADQPIADGKLEGGKMYYSTGSKTATRAGSSTGGGEPIKVSALGSDATVTLDAATPTIAEQQLADKVQVMRVADSFNVVCVTETKGYLKMINEVVRRHGARAVIHTGDFGFFDAESYQHMHIKELRNAVQFGPLSFGLRNRLMKMPDPELRKACHNVSFSDLPSFISGEERFEVPVYVIWGNQEDVHVLKKFADGSYHVPNLYILNQDSSYTISMGSHTVRLFGIGGAFLYHRFFDIGHGLPAVAGAEGGMWATLIQLGCLLELGERYKDPNEIRVLVCHVSPGKEGLVSLLARGLGADYTISGALHGKLPHMYTDFSVRTLANYMEHISQARTEVPRIWKHVLEVLGPANVKESDKKAVQRVLDCLEALPQSDLDLKSAWHLNLTDAKIGHLVLRVSGNEMRVETVLEHGIPLNIKEPQYGYGRRRSSTSKPKSSSRRPSQSHEPTTPNTTLTTKDLTGNYVLKVTGFPLELTLSDLERNFGLKYLKHADMNFKPGEFQMSFEAEAEFTRAKRSLGSMKMGEKKLQVLILHASIQVVSPSASSEAVASDRPMTWAVESTEEPSLGQRRAA